MPKNSPSSPAPKWLTAPITGYQYLSRMLPGSCRYYPTCSEYAKWSFETSPPHKALANATLRILRCNQLFPGGIDYPVVRYQAPPAMQLTSYLNILSGKIKIKYWFVPKSKNRYYVIKDYNAY
jgi:putative membrane protein insertion efficiency factor